MTKPRLSSSRKNLQGQKPKSKKVTYDKRLLPRVRPLSAPVAGTHPDHRITAPLPTCDEVYMCSWGYWVSENTFFLKYINRGCHIHGKVTAR